MRIGSDGQTAAPVPAATQKPWGAERLPWPVQVAHFAIHRRILRGALKRQILRLLPHAQDVVDVRVDGVKMRCHVTDNKTEEAIAGPNKSAAKQNIDAITAPLQPGDVFIDVGANCGLHSLFAAKRVGRSGRVVAIEPIPEMVQRMRFNIEANGYDNIVIYQTAVGGYEGEAVLHIDTRQYGKSSVVQDGAGCSPTTVPITTLKAIVERESLQRIDALKIDVEGYEDRVLLPWLRTMPRAMWPRRILYEHKFRANWQEECDKVLASLGYRKVWNSQFDEMVEL